MKDWPTKTLGELLVALETGTRPKGGVGALVGGVPSVSGEHINREGEFYWDTPKHITRDFYNGMKRGRLQKGDILVVKDGATTGKTAMVRDDFPFVEAAVNEHVFLLRTDRKKVLPEYVGYFLFGTVGQQQILSSLRGASIGGIGLDFVNKVHLPIAPLAEQERIVKLLDEAREMKKLRTDAINRTAELIPALFHQMFGEADGANVRWEMEPIKMMGKVVTGNTPPRKHADLYGEFIEWVKTDNIKPLSSVVGRATEMLSEDGARRGRIVPSGSVLITCIAGSRDRIGDAAIADRNVAINQQINAIIPSAETDSAFLCELVRAIKPTIKNRSTGVMTGIINKSSLEEIEAIVPPFGLQKEFGAAAADIRELQVSQSASHTGLEAIFQSMLHRAFIGEL